jgi:carbon storage regulator
MLVLARRPEESVIIGGRIEVKVLAVRGDQISLGFVAPDEVTIYRKEVYASLQSANRKAARADRPALSEALATLSQSLVTKQASTSRGGDVGNETRDTH